MGYLDVDLGKGPKNHLICLHMGIFSLAKVLFAKVLFVYPFYSFFVILIVVYIILSSSIRVWLRFRQLVAIDTGVIFHRHQARFAKPNRLIAILIFE